MEATLSNPQIEVRTHGRVRAAKKIILSARIGGEVIWIGPKMNEGSFFKKRRSAFEHWHPAVAIAFEGSFQRSSAVKKCGFGTIC